MDVTSTYFNQPRGGSQVWTFKNIIEDPFPNTNLGLNHAKTLTVTLDNYDYMLNIGLLGEEGVPFLLHCLLFHKREDVIAYFATYFHRCIF